MAQNCNKLYLLIIAILQFYNTANGSITCDFDSELCGWHDASTTKYQWTRGTGKTEDRTSGPINDHTCDNFNGGYIAIQGQNSEGPTDVGVLQSETISIQNTTSLSFWFIMNGYGTGALSLYSVVGNNSMQIWKKDGRQGKEWIHQSVSVPQGTIKLEFRASVRIPVGSDVALDDIVLESESISLNKTHCARTTASTTRVTVATTTELPVNKTRKISSSTRLTSASSVSTCAKLAFNNDILPGTCDFEKDTCGIKIISNDTNKATTWTRSNQMDGTTYDADTIFGDHTFEKSNATKGYYMHFENGGGYTWFSNPKEIASLETPAIYSDYTCLTFWYITPRSGSNLEVLIRSYQGILQRIWSVDNEKNDTTIHFGWQKLSLSLNEDPPFTVVFRVFANHHQARVGIDDIKIVGVNITSFVTKPVTENMTNPVFENVTKPVTEIITKPVIENVTKPVNETLTKPVTEPTTKAETSKTTTSIPNSPTNTGSHSTSGNVITKTSKLSTPSKAYKTTEEIKKTTQENDKKTTENSTKKPTAKPEAQEDEGKVDTQLGKENREKTSVIVGSSVGGVLAVIFIALLTYSFIHCMKINKRKERENKANKSANGNLKEKTASNGHVMHVYDNFAASSLNNSYLHTSAPPADTKSEITGSNLEHPNGEIENTRF